MDEGLRRANAACGLAALLLAWALARTAPEPVACPVPSERRAKAGHSVELACRSASRGAPLRGPARLLVGERIDPNRADAATLESLPGIGPARALAILATRARGRFRSIDDLTRVPGIGPRTLAGIAGWLQIHEAPETRESSRLGPLRRDPVGCAQACERAPPEGES